MTAEEKERREEIQRAVLPKIRNGTATPEDKLALWESVRKFAAKVAEKYAYALRTSGELEDLESESYLATMACAQSYNPDAGPFINYLAYYLQNAFAVYIEKQGGRSRSARQRLQKIDRFIDSYIAVFGHEPTDEEICKRCAIQPGTLRYLRLMGYTDSLDEPAAEDDDRRRHDPPAPDDTEAEAIERVIASGVRSTLNKFIRELPARERRAVGLYYYSGLTIKQGAAKMQITESQFLTLRNRGIKRLRGFKCMDELRRWLPERAEALAYRRPRPGGPWRSSTEQAAFAAMKQVRLAENEKYKHPRKYKRRNGNEYGTDTERADGV